MISNKYDLVLWLKYCFIHLCKVRVMFWLEAEHLYSSNQRILLQLRSKSSGLLQKICCAKCFWPRLALLAVLFKGLPMGYDIFVGFERCQNMILLIKWECNKANVNVHMSPKYSHINMECSATKIPHTHIHTLRYNCCQFSTNAPICLEAIVQHIQALRGGILLRCFHSHAG